VTALAVTLCSVDAFGRWASRAIPRFVEPVTSANRAEFEQFRTINAQVEGFVATLLGGWTILALLIALAIVSFGLSRRATRRRTILLATAATTVTLVTYSGIVVFLQVVSISVVTIVPVGPVMLLGRLGMIVVAILAIGRTANTGVDELARSGTHADELELSHG
jgi:hypothetical protein